MKALMNYLQPVISSPAATGFTLAAASAGALAMAFIAENLYVLDPCILCLYQRAPFAIAILLGLLTVWTSYLFPKAAPWMLSGLGVVFLTNSVISAYHTGVERGWWKSFIEGCSVPSLEGNITDVLARIESRVDAPRCDEIPWADPIIGLSMANYNILFCLMLAAMAGLAACKAFKNNA